jgi:Flagellar biosynthesis protein, FliO
MSPVQSAARAANQQIWPEGLRISEAVHASEQAARIPYADTLRTVSQYLQAGWKWLERKRTQQLSSRRLRLAETISLGEKRSVSIVQVDGAQFLIGCSSGSVQLLAVLDKQDDATRQLSEIEAAS